MNTTINSGVQHQSNDYTAFIEKGKTDTGVIEAGQELKQLEQEKDKVTLMQTLSGKELREEYQDYSASDYSKLTQNVMRSQAMIAHNGTILYPIAGGATLLTLFRSGLLSQASQFGLLAGFVASCFVMVPLIWKISDSIIEPMRMNRGIKKQLVEKEKHIRIQIEEKKAECSAAQARFQNWQKKHDVTTWLTPENTTEVNINEEFVDVDGVRLKVHKNAAHIALMKAERLARR